MTLMITMVALAIVLLLANAVVDLYKKLRPHKSSEDINGYSSDSPGSSGSTDTGTQPTDYSHNHHSGFDGGSHGGFSGHGGDFGGGHGH